MPVPPFPPEPNKGGRPKKRYSPGDPGEPVILRVRMRRRLLNRIKAIADHDRAVLHEAWNVSDACREVLVEWAERREADIRRANEAGFTGLPPEVTPPGLGIEAPAEPAGEDEDDDEIAVAAN